MVINTKNTFKTVRLDTLKPGDTFALPTTCGPIDDFYIVVEPDYELDFDAGIYCVNLRSGELYRFEYDEEVMPVKLEATASF